MILIVILQIYCIITGTIFELQSRPFSMSERMHIRQYFKKNFDLEAKLPPTASVSKATIRAVEKELKERSIKATSKRGSYIKVTDEERAKIGGYAANFGATEAIRHFKRDYPDLKESTVRGWKNDYRDLESKSLGSRKRSSTAIQQLPTKCRGRPLLIGDHLETEVCLLIEALRKDGTAVNTEVVIGTAIGVVTSYDANLLTKNGGPIDISKEWAKRLLRRMGLVKRQGTTKSKVNPTDFQMLKKQYLSDIRTKVYMEDIPVDLIINWDHTSLKYVPVSNWTMEHKGAKRVEIAGCNDKQQMTALFTCTLNGKFLPPQVIYAGKTPACLPKVKFPDGWNVVFTLVQ